MSSAPSVEVLRGTLRGFSWFSTGGIGTPAVTTPAHPVRKEELRPIGTTFGDKRRTEIGPRATVSVSQYRRMPP